MRIVMLFYLAGLGIRDFVDRRIPLIWILTGFPFAIGWGIFRCAEGELGWCESLLGLIPGIALMVIAYITKKAGYGDGLVLMQLGVCLGYRESVFLFCVGLILLAVVSVILLFLKVVRRDTKMPYLTFLAVAFMLGQI